MGIVENNSLESSFIRRVRLRNSFLLRPYPMLMKQKELLAHLIQSEGQQKNDVPPAVKHSHLTPSLSRAFRLHV